MKNIKKISLIILTIITILSLFSCNVYNVKQKKSNENETIYETTEALSYDNSNGFASFNAKMAMVSSQYSDFEDIATIDSNDRKIIKSVSLNTETKDFDGSIEWLKNYVLNFNGVIDNSYIDTGDISSKNYKKNAFYSIRIPSDKLDSFLGKIGDNLNITFKQESISDITEDYFDSESKLNSLKIEEENLNEMLKKAKSVDEMIKVEDKLSEVRANIESINKRIKNYDKQINYSRVDISIFEVKDLTDTKANENDFSKETLNKKLLKTVDDVKLFLKKVAAYIFINIPWIIFALVVILIEIILYSIIKAVFFKNKKTNDNSENKDLNDEPIKNENKSYSEKKKYLDDKENKDDNKKEELSNEEVFDKAMEEINRVVLGEGAHDTNGDAEFNSYNNE